MENKEKAPRLIEVALPVQEISAESVRDKSIRHGHISTLHLWWARRPLPVSRAVVFASLLPDPDNTLCPQAFIDAIRILLNNPEDGSAGAYKPYDHADAPADTPRNRLLMFIGKFSDKYLQDERVGKKTDAKNQIADLSLIKWDNKNNPEIIGIARKLIFVAYNAEINLYATATDLLHEYKLLDVNIKQAEEKLYGIVNRHLPTPEVEQAEAELQKAIERFLEKMPAVFDPFAGGGAIPLEAARLGCRSYGNDINPVAHIIQRGSLEFAQRFGKPITITADQYKQLYGQEAYQQLPNQSQTVYLPNRLSHDVDYYARLILARAEKKIGHLYPADKNGKRPIAYYWARTAKCSNPTCNAEVPLLKQFYMANTDRKKVYLNPIIDKANKTIDFEITHGECKIADGWMDRANLKCPICGNITKADDLKKQFKTGKASKRLLAVIDDGDKGKEYRKPRLDEISAEIINIELDRPTEPMPIKYTQAMPSCTWGFEQWGQMFTDRQLYAMQTLVAELNQLKTELPLTDDYKTAIITYLAIWVDRIVLINTNLARYNNIRETIEHPFSRQAIAMVFDFPESNLFSNSTGSALNQLEWLYRYIESEGDNTFITALKNASSGDMQQFNAKSLTAVVTDPPYYDAIAYADLSDFFYVWLKRTLGDVFPLNFATPQTPKSDECTALKHHHNGSAAAAEKHFENKLKQIFTVIEQQTNGVVSIMFAHQSTKAWSTLINSILGSNMNITGSWAMDSEMGNRMLALSSSALVSSVTVVAKPVVRIGEANLRDIKRKIEDRVALEVKKLLSLGFRGADLLTACFGQAVSVFGGYQTVAKIDGTVVTPEELLKMARDAAFKALVQNFDTDMPTRMYMALLQLNGFTEVEHTELVHILQVGANIDVNTLVNAGLLVKSDKNERLATYTERVGKCNSDSQIDQLHHMMYLLSNDRGKLIMYMRENDISDDSHPLWRSLVAFVELLPKGQADQKQAELLLISRDSLLREVKQRLSHYGEQTQLEIN